MITNSDTGTRVDEIGDGIHRIHTPVKIVPGGFSFNQYLVVDDEPLLFHTGPRRLLPVVRQAIAAVMPVERLRWLAFSHVEADECGGLNGLLELAPQAQPVCGRVASMVSVEDLADRPPRALADGETLRLGARTVRWLDTPHMPHAWECGLLFEESTRTLFCGDLFTQPGLGDEPLVEHDILEPSEAFRQAMDYYSHTRNAGPILERVAATRPTTLACMHGSAWHGDGSKILGELGRRLAQ